jgi:hypothetical protein
LKSKTIAYLIPYLLLLLLGPWYRYHVSGLVFLDGDSGDYLLPAYMKKICGVWHKGERPMQYLQFICLTLSPVSGLRYTVILQQLLGLTGGACLAAGWVIFVNNLRNPIIWHLAGYFMLAIYISSPELMYYEQFIGPEAYGIFLMCALIFCLSVVFRERADGKSPAIFLGLAIFLNLYLANPMTKWIFSSLFLELVLLWIAIKKNDYSTAQRFRLLLVPHLLYLLLVLIPEWTHPADTAEEDRTYIEWKQMAYPF